jgi:hypothetical protein
MWKRPAVSASSKNRSEEWESFTVPPFAQIRHFHGRVVELSGLQRPGDLVSTEDDAGRHCFRADEFE